MTKKPVKYSPEIGLKICQAISTSEKGLHKLCKQNADFPTVTCIMNWLLDGKHPEFVDQYARAREEQAEFMVESIIDIADDSSRDISVNESGNIIENKEFISRARLRVDARKWISAHLKPKKYADRIDLKHEGSISMEPLLIDKVNNAPDLPNPEAKGS